jgi:hypothetical protein
MTEEHLLAFASKLSTCHERRGAVQQASCRPANEHYQIFELADIQKSARKTNLT